MPSTALNALNLIQTTTFLFKSKMLLRFIMISAKSRIIATKISGRFMGAEEKDEFLLQQIMCSEPLINLTERVFWRILTRGEDYYLMEGFTRRATTTTTDGIDDFWFLNGYFPSQYQASLYNKMASQLTRAIHIISPVSE
jgi:hypothetical protein